MLPEKQWKENIRMNDRDFLIWLHARLTDVHGENPMFDYTHKLRAIIVATPADKETPNIGQGGNSIGFVLEKIAKENECSCKPSPVGTDMLMIDQKCPRHGVRNKKVTKDWLQEIYSLDDVEKELVILAMQYKSGQHDYLIDCLQRVRMVRDSLFYDMRDRRIDNVKY